MSEFEKKNNYLSLNQYLQANDTSADALTIKDVTIVVSIISSSFSLFVLINYIYFKSSRTFSKKLVAFLCSSDLIFSLSHLIYFKNQQYTEYNQQVLCQFQGFLISFSGLSSTIWSSLIIISIYISVIQNIKNIKAFQLWFILIGFIFPSLISLIPLFIDLYGPIQSQDNYGSFCWLQIYKSEEKSTSFFSLIFFFIPLWVLFFLNCICIIVVMKKIKERNINYFNNQKKMLYYPLIIVVCWLPATVHRIIDMVEKECPHFSLLIMHILCGQSIGIFHTFIYGFNDQIFQKLKNFCQKKFNVIQNNQNLGDSQILALEPEQYDNDQYNSKQVSMLQFNLTNQSLNNSQELSNKNESNNSNKFKKAIDLFE